MRQDSRIEPTTPSSPTKMLHPVLSSALSNLDIQLEDELARYRRQRVGTVRPARQSGRKSASHMLDLIAVSATGGSTETLTDVRSTSERSERTAKAVNHTVDTAYKPTPAFAASPRPTDSAIALRTPEQSPLSGNDSYETTLDGTNATHALAQSNNPNLDDYLESSEELLRSLADEEAEVRSERSFLHSLLTPFGLGSMLLLLLSSAMFGYVIMNPSSLGHLMAWRTGNAEPSNVPATGSTTGQAVPSRPDPDLTAQNFRDLNLKTLGTIDPNSSAPAATVPTTKSTKVSKDQSSTTTAKPTTVTPQLSPEASTPAATTQAPIPAATTSGSSRPAPIRTYTPPQAAAPSRTAAIPQRSAPVRTYTAPLPPPVSAPTVSASANRSPSGGYPVKVVTHYDGDSALTKSRTVVPDAYLRNFPDGAKIQLGAYDNATTAEAKAQELRSRGIPAEVYKP